MFHQYLYKKWIILLKPLSTARGSVERPFYLFKIYLIDPLILKRIRGVETERVI